MKTNKILFLVLMFMSNVLAAQVCITADGSNPDISSMLDVKSTSKGLLIPRMTSSQRSSISTPANGLLVYDLTSNSFWYFKNSLWNNLGDGNKWSLTGNSGTDPSSNFIGTTDNIALKFRINNHASGIIDPLASIANTSFGYMTLNEITSAKNNVAFGFFSLRFDTSGNDNSAFGYEAMRNNTSGYENTAVGRTALRSNTSGMRNTALGTRALYSNITGYGNNAFGYESLYKNTTGSSNSGFGWQSLWSNTTGTDNTANGPYALYYNLIGSGNAAVGTLALHHNTDGNFNIGCGYSALYSNTTGSSNVAIGTQALMNSVNKDNLVAIGDSALYKNGMGNYVISQGIRNTAIGSKSMCENISGSFNTALGFRTLYANTSGSTNVGVGHRTLEANTTGSFNTGVGNLTMNLNNDGNGNSAFGDEALKYNVDGDFNTASGTLALYNNQSGNQNTAAGYKSLILNTSGSANVGCGGFSLQTNTIGSGNAGIGYSADVSLNNLGTATAIGGWATATSSNSVIIGSSTITSIGGFVGWSNFSDSRFYKHIREDVPGLVFIKKLRPVTFTWDAEGITRHVHRNHHDTLVQQIFDQQQEALHKQGSITYSGLVAQEVEEAARECWYDFSGIHVPENNTDVYSLRYSELIPSMIKAIQEQQVIIEKLEAEIERLKMQ